MNEDKPGDQNNRHLSNGFNSWDYIRMVYGMIDKDEIEKLLNKHEKRLDDLEKKNINNESGINTLFYWVDKLKKSVIKNK